MNSPLRHASRRGSFALAVVVTLTLLIAAGGAYYYFAIYQKEDITESLITTLVKKDRFQHIVLEQGEVESSKNVDVVCNVKSRNREGTGILWVIEEGARVKAGDKLVELDASALDQEIKQQRIIVNSSRAMMISAQSALEQAEVAKEEYLEGQFKQEEQMILSEILVAEENLSRAQENAAFSEELAAQGFQTQVQLKADKFSVQKNQVDLKLAENKLNTLRQITKRKMLIGFDADIETAKAKYESEVSSHEEEVDKLKELEEQLKLCVITAPEDGQVVHANKFSSRGGSAEFVVEPGAMVRERQTIIRLPDPNNMQVKAKINESKISLVSEGMPVRVRIGAFEETTLDGIVTKVNKYAEPGGWFSSQVKEYATLIKIVDPPPEVRTGMTAEVQILVEQLDDALLIPVQALVNYRAHYFAVVLKNGKAETREITIGPTDDKMVVIKSGLKEGETVVMNPKNHDEILDLPDLPEPDADQSEGGRGKGQFASSPGPRRPGGPPAGRPGASGPPSGRPGAAGRPGAPGQQRPGDASRLSQRPSGGRPSGGPNAEANSGQPAAKKVPAEAVAKEPENQEAENNRGGDGATGASE